MSEPLRHIALVADESDLVAALRQRADELNVSRSEIDAGARLPNGYTSKRLAVPQIKYYGRDAFWNTAESLGLAVLLVEDPNATARYARKMAKRSKPQAVTGPDHWRHARALSILQEIARKTGSEGARVKNQNTSKRRRKQIARHAAVIRWEQVKKAVKGQRA